MPVPLGSANRLIAQASTYPPPGRQASRPGWTTGLLYVLLVLMSVAFTTAVVMVASVYFRRRW